MLQGFKRIIIMLSLLGLALGRTGFGQTYPSAIVTIGGAEQIGGSGWDSQILTISFNGYSESVTYGQFSTPSSIASAFAAKFSVDTAGAHPCMNGICAKATGASVVFQLAGDGSFGPVSVTPPTSSFSINTSQWPSSAAPQISVSCSPDTMHLGSSATCTAVSTSSRTVNIDFVIDGYNTDGNDLTEVPVSNGVAVLRNFMSDQIAGQHTVTAFDDDFPTLMGSTVVTIDIPLVCWPSLIPLGQTTACTATVSRSGTTTMTFKVDGNDSTQVPVINGLAMLASYMQDQLPGSHTITVADPGNPGVRASYVVTVESSNVSPANLYHVSVPSSNGYDKNGNILSYTDSINGNWSLTYDYLNRLATAAVGPVANQTSQSQYMCWSYDLFGNRTNQSTAGGAYQGGGGATCQAGTNSQQDAWATYNQNNQVTGTAQTPSYSASAYDAAGNLMQDGPNQYLYDAEGRVCAVANSPVSGGTFITIYVYDADGNRVAKGSNSVNAFTCDTSTNFYATTTYGLNSSDSPTTEYDRNGNWARTDVLAGRELIATYMNDNEGVHFHVTDWLGTRRVQTNYAGLLEISFTNAPFGDKTGAFPSPSCQSSAGCAAVDTSDQHFTGQNHDMESGNDYFGARYYSSSAGRFLSPDWSDSSDSVPYANLVNPQSLNLFSYVVNNPMSWIDTDGHKCGASTTATITVNSNGSSLGNSSSSSSTMTQATPTYEPCTSLDDLPSGDISRGLGVTPGSQGGAGLLRVSSFRSAQQHSQSAGSAPESIGSKIFNQPFVYNTLYDTGTFASGAADVLTYIPFYGSLTKKINATDGGASSIGYGSGFYTAGKVTGIGLGVADVAAGGFTGAALADGKAGSYFGGGPATVFNGRPSGAFIRFGWGWNKNIGTAGADIIRLGIGPARGTAWWSHFTFWIVK